MQWCIDRKGVFPSMKNTHVEATLHIGVIHQMLVTGISKPIADADANHHAGDAACLVLPLGKRPTLRGVEKLQCPTCGAGRSAMVRGDGVIYPPHTPLRIAREQRRSVDQARGDMDKALRRSGSFRVPSISRGGFYSPRRSVGAFSA